MEAYPVPQVCSWLRRVTEPSRSGAYRSVPSLCSWGLIANVIYTLLTEVLPTAGSTAAGYLITLYLAVMIVFNFCGATVVESFVEQPNTDQQNLVEPLVSSMEEGVQLEGQSFCQACASSRPAAAHHCSTCSRCVIGKDHHCLFVGQCIGHLNQRFYACFLLFLWIGTLWTLWWAKAQVQMPESQKERLLWGLSFVSFPFALVFRWLGWIEYQNSAHFITMFGSCVGAGFGVFVLMVYSFTLISIDSTPFERTFGLSVGRPKASMFMCWKRLLGGDKRGWWWRWTIPNFDLPDMRAPHYE